MIRLRILLALALVVGFYTLALGIVAALSWALWTIAHSGPKMAFLKVKFGIACGVGIWFILAAIRPRFEKFVAPGPRLEKGRHPRLFRALEDVARAAGQPMPADVYLISDVNAFVAQRGGFMGIGGRRIMGIGFPLLCVDTVDQFRATVGHEFGHFHGGDTRLGPWIYAARMGIIRTVENLDERFLQLPFRWYGTLFMRITFHVSRRQELLADELASRIAGVQANGSSLKVESRGALAFRRYMELEFIPALEGGYFPPLMDGFVRFMKAKDVAPKLDAFLRDQLENPEPDPYDSHPPLSHRLKAMGYRDAADAPAAPLAITLIPEYAAMEREFMADITGNPKALKLPALPWEDVGEKVWKPVWENAIRTQGAAFSDVPVTRLREAVEASRGPRRQRPGAESAEADSKAWYLGGAALALALSERGWSVRSLPGDPIVLHKGDAAVEPFNLVAELKEGKITDEEWRRRCAELGIAA